LAKATAPSTSSSNRLSALLSRTDAAAMALTFAKNESRQILRRVSPAMQTRDQA
jgi:hypothetical protein